MKTLKPFFCDLKGENPLNKIKNTQRPNSEVIPIDWYHFQPPLVFAGQYL